MRLSLALVATAFFASPVSAKSDYSVASSFAKAVRNGGDLQVQFPGVLTSTDATTLRSVAGCNSQSPYLQAKGRYSIVFNCGRKGAVFAIIVVSDGRVVGIETGQAVKVQDGRVN